MRKPKYKPISNNTKMVALILLLILMAIMAIVLSSCNKSPVDIVNQFDYALVSLGNGEILTIEIKSWTDYEDGEQLQLWSSDNKVYLVSSNNTILIRGNPPTYLLKK